MKRIRQGMLGMWLLLTSLAWGQAPIAAYDTSYARLQPVLARHGMAVSEQRLASDIGVDILRHGGNAVDAAVAMGFALAVVLPEAGNLGGGGFMLIHDARHGRDIALDFRETAPAAARRDLFLNEQGQVQSDKALRSHAAVGVPGSVAGLCLAQQKYGRLRLSQVLAPARRLAHRGVIVSPELGRILALYGEVMAPWPASRAIFFKDSRPLRAGERLVQTDLARSLDLIARHGPSAFYRGELARRIAAEMALRGGLITVDDLAAYRALERQPLRGRYRGFEVVTMPPPSAGGVMLIQSLNQLQTFSLKDDGLGSARSLHLMAEVLKRAFVDRASYLGDPDFQAMPVAGMISPAYGAHLAVGIDLDHATPAGQLAPGRPMDFESDQTTHYSVVDDAGNAVAVTYTLNLAFGSGIVVPGTGILLNNEMDDFVAKPGAVNMFGLSGGEANAIAPGKRPLSSMTPTLVLKDGKLWAVTGSPGGSRIVSTVLQILVNLIDFGLNPAEAAAQPRIHHQWQPDELRVEPGFSPDSLNLLTARGHAVKLKPTMGRAQTIQVRPDGLAGASDPRGGDGAAVGY